LSGFFVVLDVRSTTVAVWQKGHSACPSLAPRDPVDEEAPDPVAIFYRPALLSTTPANLRRAGTPARPAAAAYAAAASAVKRGNEEQWRRAVETSRVRAGRFKWVEPDQVGTAPSMVQGHPMSKTKFFLSKTGCNWVAMPTGSISKNQSVSRQKMENAVSANKDASFGMSNIKICLVGNTSIERPL